MTTQQKAGAGVLAELDLAIGRNIERGAAKGSPSDKSLREVRAAVAALIAERDALREIVLELLPIVRDVAPRSCGACGTPVATCDMDCVVAASISELCWKAQRLTTGESA